MVSHEWAGPGVESGYGAASVSMVGWRATVGLQRRLGCVMETCWHVSPTKATGQHWPTWLGGWHLSANKGSCDGNMWTHVSNTWPMQLRPCVHAP